MSPVSPLSLDHVVVPVGDAAAARVFYRDVLGLPLVGAFSGDVWGGRSWLMMVFVLGAGGQHIAITAFSGIDRAPTSPFPRDARHVAFAVASVAEWEAWKARLAGAKVDHWVEDHGEQRSLYAVDPSGNVLEIKTPASAPFEAHLGEGADAAVDAWLVADGRSRLAP